MLKKTIKSLSLFFGAVCGVALAFLVIDLFEKYFKIVLAEYLTEAGIVIFVIAFAVFFGILFYILSEGFSEKLLKFLSKTERDLSKVPMQDLVLGIAGLITGLLIAFFIGQAIGLINIPIISITANIFLYALLGALGVKVALSRRDDISSVGLFKRRREGKKDIVLGNEPAYVLDSSVIIDGRIVEVISIGFICGSIIVPNFIINEIRKIADSDDEFKHAKGRRGLDMLTKLQGIKSITLKIDDAENENLSIDENLIKAAENNSATLITNDYNLNKIGQVRGVKVLNLNDLSNAVKPILIAGEELDLLIVKEGKGANQGVAYLDDGTMIVIENGRDFVGEKKLCVVTSVLQTSAGRMIFARICD